MLLRPDVTYIDSATNRAERVFPRGSGWRHFESRFPSAEVFDTSVLDPAIGIKTSLGLDAFASADWSNWIQSWQIGLFEIGTRVGLPPIETGAVADAVAQVYTSALDSLAAFSQADDPSEMLPELLRNSGLQVIQQISGFGGLIGQTVGQVLAAAVWAVDVATSARAQALGKDTPRPPLQSEDPATDTWQVNMVFEILKKRSKGGIVFPDGGVEPRSNADYTDLFLPAYYSAEPWQIQQRDKGVAAQQGRPRKARGPGGNANYQFNVVEGRIGFMPGTSTTLRVLQASYRFYQSLRGTPVDQYALRCRAKEKGCFQTVKTFDGSRDCRQCVKAESVWPQKGLGWAYGGSPLNATTPGQNVGAFYPSLNKLCDGLLRTISRRSPLLYTVAMDHALAEWQESFEQFWEFARREWRRFPAPGWRGLVSRLATLMTAYQDENDSWRLGGRDPAMPARLIASPLESRFDIQFSESVFSRIIRPFCESVAASQLYYLDTYMVAYISPGAGALYSRNGSFRRNALAEHFVKARRDLLNSTKRMHVDLRQVQDPEYREALVASGVKVSRLNPALQGSPGAGGRLIAPELRPKRVPLAPKFGVGSAFEGFNTLARARPKSAVLTMQTRTETRALGVATAAAALTSAGVWYLHRRGKKSSEQ